MNGSWHQAITQTKDDLSWKVFNDIHLRAFSQEVIMNLSVVCVGL